MTVATVPDTLPKRMAELRAALTTAGWRTAVSPGVDTGGCPWLTLDAVSPPLPVRAQVRATWHTRATDGKTYRLFSCMIFEPYRGWHHLTVKALLEKITPPTPEQTESVTR